MPPIYKAPQGIYTPKDMITDVDVIYDGGDKGVSIAKIIWDNKEVIGIRWNIALKELNDTDKKLGNKDCLGHPVSRGYPTWFILPKEIFYCDSDIVRRVKEVLNENNCK